MFFLSVILISACAPENLNKSQPTLLSNLPISSPVPLAAVDEAAPTNVRIVDENEYVIQQSVPLDGIFPVYSPEFVSASQAPYHDDELVIGVARNGEAKAFSVTVLRYREIVNDELSGMPILVTFCPLCFTGMVHERSIDGETIIFGNYGGLFMSAMTWYDHKSNSIWAQPWGRAIAGELKGVQLNLIASQMTTWGEWKQLHPDSLAMINDYERLASFKLAFWDGFVVGINLAGEDKAYYFKDLRNAGLVNDELAATPIVLWATENSYAAYSRLVDGQELTFSVQNGIMVDDQTGTKWEGALGLAIEGPLAGSLLQGIPSSSSYDWGWFDFYPESLLFDPIDA